MKISELLNEDLDTLSASNRAGKHGTSSKVHNHYSAAIKGFQTYPGKHTYYDMYRFGVDMAGSPDDTTDFEQASPVANQLATLAYTDADQQIINKSSKKMGMKGKQLTSKDSIEHNDVHSVSPVAKIKRNKYGI